MLTFPRLLFFCLGLCVFSTPVQARHGHQAAPPAAAPLATPSSEPAPLPAEAAPKISPDAPPSASLQPFIDAHLGQILAPLGTSAFAQPEVIASLKAGYADGMAVAPADHRPAFQAAQNVCDALVGAMTERQNAVAALRGALATRSSEAAQPRGGGEAVTNAQHDDAFFTDSQKNNWIQHAGTLRQTITTLYLRERAIERQIGVWTPPPPPGAAPAVAAATPAPTVRAPARSAQALTEQLNNSRWKLSSGKEFTLHAGGSTNSSWHRRRGRWAVIADDTVELMISHTESPPDKVTVDPEATSLRWFGTSDYAYRIKE